MGLERGSICRKQITYFLLMGSVFLLLAGCSGTPERKQDPFFEKWSVKARESQGKSPAARERTISVPEEPPAKDRLRDEALPARKLPEKPVTLKMNNADVNVVLRALAWAAEQNILIKPDIKGKVSVDFKAVPWDEAFLGILRSNMLTYVWEGNIIRIATLEDIENDLKLEALEKKRQEQVILQKRLSPLLTMVIPIDYADPGKLKENLQTLLVRNEKGESHGSVQVSEHTGSLIVQATREDLLRIVAMVEKIDRPTPQIRIEANIVEATKDTARNLGIQWGGLGTGTVNDYQVFVTPGGGGGTAGSSPVSGGYTPTYGDTGIGGHGFGVNFPTGEAAVAAAGGVGSLGLIVGKLGQGILEVQLQALQKEGKLNILSSPSITTIDNQTAFTENGEKVPYVSVDKDGNREVKFEDAVLRLEITPHVIDGENLKMKIVVKKDEVDFTRKVEENPLIVKKQTDTNLIVSDGETIVISGLSKQRNSDVERGVPWLKDVPVLGYLFKGQDRSESLEEVLIFITPRILKAEGGEVRG